MFGGTSGWCRRRAVPAATILALITTAGLVVSPAQVSAASTTNLGVSVWESTWAALDGGGAAFIVRESEEGSDLDGDGDVNDFVLHRWDPDTGVTNLGISVGTNEGPVALDGGGIAAAQRFPRRVVIVDDAGGVTDLGIPPPTYGGITALDGGGLAIPVDESLYGVDADLNGDGDRGDIVVHVWDPITGISNLGIAAGDEYPVALDGGGVSFVGYEFDQDGTDLNGDGDATDYSVVHVWDPVSGVRNLGIESQSSYFAALDGGGIAFFARESGQSSSDLNGDGDTVRHRRARVGAGRRSLQSRARGGNDRPVGSTVVASRSPSPKSIQGVSRPERRRRPERQRGASVGLCCGYHEPRGR